MVDPTAGYAYNNSIERAQYITLWYYYTYFIHVSRTLYYIRLVYVADHNKSSSVLRGVSSCNHVANIVGTLYINKIVDITVIAQMRALSHTHIYTHILYIIYNIILIFNVYKRNIFNSRHWNSLGFKITSKMLKSSFSLNETK